MATNLSGSVFNNIICATTISGFRSISAGCAFPDGFFEKMQPKVEKAFAAMRELEAGGIANPDEKRMVGHYWLRDAAARA